MAVGQPHIQAFPALAKINGEGLGTRLAVGYLCLLYRRPDVLIPVRFIMQLRLCFHSIES